MRTDKPEKDRFMILLLDHVHEAVYQVGSHTRIRNVVASCDIQLYNDAHSLKTHRKYIMTR
jgi:hypothetical protein